MSKWFSTAFLDECVTRTISLIPCSNNLVDDVLNHRLVDDRYLFRNGFCGWQHMHASPATGMTAFKLIIISSTLKWLTNYSS